MISKSDFCEKCDFTNVIYVESCDFEKVNFAENAILEMRISSIMWFWTCEFLDKMWIFAIVVHLAKKNHPFASLTCSL